MTEKQMPEARNVKTEGGNYCERIERHYIAAETVNIYESAINNLRDTVDKNGKQATDKKLLAFAIAGSIDEVDQAKLKAIVALLQKISGDASIEIIRLEEGSIRIILNGSEEGLERIKKLVESGELTKVLGTSVEYAQFVDREHSTDLEDTELDNKSRLVREILPKLVKGRNLNNIELGDANSRQDSVFQVKQKTYTTQGGNTIIVLIPVGSLHTTTAWQFRQKLQECISKLSRYVVVNLGQVNFIDVSGLTSLVVAMRDTDKVKGSFSICNLHPEVKFVFEVTQLDKVFEIFETEEEALKSLGSHIAPVRVNPKEAYQ